MNEAVGLATVLAISGAERVAILAEETREDAIVEVVKAARYL